MASRIAGITVEIGGDTLKLKQALSDVEGKIKQTQRELKDVEKLLKLDPHNTELLTQKQNLLNTAIDETKKKLETLRAAEEQAKTALANGDITEKQFDALKREIISTEQELDKLTEKLKHTDSVTQATLKELGGKFKETGEKITSVGTTMSKNVTAPIVAVGAAATLAFSEIDEGYDTIIKKTGATGESFEGLKEVADNIFKTLPVDMSDVGVAVGEVNTRFKVTGDELEELSTLFLKFAEINETDLNTAIGMTNKIMVQWGVDTKETANVLGLITQKAQDTGISVDALMNGVQQHGSVLKEMGLNLSQSINLLAQFEANGVNADQALRGLRKAVAAYTKDGLSMDEALKKTIDSIKNAGSETEALNIATQIFGTKGATEMTRAIREGRISFDDLSKSISEYGDVVDKTFEGTEDGIDKFKVASNNAKLALGSLGEAISDVLGPILQGVATALGAVASWLNSLSPTAKQIVVIIGLIVAAIGPLLVIIGTVIGAIGNIITGVAAISGAFSAMSGVMAGLSGAILPILAIIAAVVALVAIGSYLKEHWSEIKDFFVNLWEGIKTYFSETWTAISTTITIAWEIIKNYFTTTLTAIQLIFITIWDSIKTYFQETWQTISTAITVAWEIIKTYFQTTFTVIQTIFTTVWDSIKEFLSTTWEVIKTIFQTVLDVIKNIITSYWDFVFQTTSTIWTSIKEFLSNIWQNISNFINTIVQTISDFISTAWNNIKSVISSILDAIFSTVSNIWNSIYSTISNLVSSAYNYVENVFNNMLSAIGNIVGNISSTIQNGFESAVDYIWGLIKSAYSWGSDLISGIVNGIRDKIGAVVESVKGVAETIWSYLHFSVPEVGPLTDYESWMPDFVKGLSKSLDDSRGLLKTSVSKLSNDLVISPSFQGLMTPKVEKTSSLTNNELNKIIEAINIPHEQSGDIVIPVYLGGTMLDEIIINAQNRQIIKSGGR